MIGRCRCYCASRSLLETHSVFTGPQDVVAEDGVFNYVEEEGEEKTRPKELIQNPSAATPTVPPAVPASGDDDVIDYLEEP
jgi:hypothetical protein